MNNVRNNTRVVFMGSPDFAVASLDRLHKSGYDIVAVITAADKPAGRGRQLRESAVKAYAVEHGIPVMQPPNLKAPAFVSELSGLDADIFVVVAFRMLPQVVWSLPSQGTFNLHASLLPDYRGAAPINWALIQGEKETGLTTFFIDRQIDTGEIILQKTLLIDPEETAGELTLRMQDLGADLVLQTVDAIRLGEAPSRKQAAGTGEPKSAPKIHKEDCRIDWSGEAQAIHNFIRGLSPYPTAWTELAGASVKLFRSQVETEPLEDGPPGTLESDGRTFLRVACGRGWIRILELQLEGKKRMGTLSFLPGFRNHTQQQFH